MFIVFTTVFSSLPDLDQNWHEFGITHRGITHSIIFGLIFGVVFGGLFWYFLSVSWGVLIFFSVFGGVLSHLLGDIIAGRHQTGAAYKIEPLQPFSDKSVGFGWFKATNERKNRIFLTLGSLALILYILIGIGMIQEFMDLLPSIQQPIR